MRWPVSLWEKIATTAHAGFAAWGRGAIVFDVLPLVSRGGPEPLLAYLTAAQLTAAEWAPPECAAAAAAYDPAAEVVLVARGLKGEVITCTVSTTDGRPPDELYAELVRVKTEESRAARLKVARMTHPLDLDDYAAGLELRFDDGPPRPVRVWVNPTLDLMQDFQATISESLALPQKQQAAGDDPDQRQALAADVAALDQRVCALLAELWSQGSDAATHWTAEDVQALAGNDTDPALFVWLVQRTAEMIRGHRAGKPVNAGAPARRG